MMEVSEIRDFKGYRAFCAFHKMMLGLKMLPMYMAESYDEFFERIHAMPEEDQRKVIREAAVFVELEREEVEAMACFCKDANGVPYKTENLKSLDPPKILDIIEAVAMKCVKWKIDAVTEAEKKN